jgi:hypothetical protein
MWMPPTSVGPEQVARGDAGDRRQRLAPLQRQWSAEAMLQCVEWRVPAGPINATGGQFVAETG